MSESPSAPPTSERSTTPDHGSAPPATPSPPHADEPSRAEPPPPASGRQRRSRLPLVVGVALVLAMAAGLGAVMALGGSDDDADASEGAADTDDASEDAADADEAGDTAATAAAGAGDSDSDGVAGAEAVVRRYFQAVLDQDCGAMFDAVSEASWSDDADSAQEAIERCEAAVDAGELDFAAQATLDHLQVVEQSDDRVTFDATETINGEELHETFVVIDEDGDWRVDLSHL